MSRSRSNQHTACSGARDATSGIVRTMLQVAQSVVDTPVPHSGSRGAAQRPLGRFGVVAIVGSGLLLVAICAGSIWAAGRSATVLQNAQDLRLRRAAVTDIMIEAESAETAQRGFLLTTNPSYLPPLEHAASVMPELLRAVAMHRAGDLRFSILRQVVTAKLAELQQTVRLQQNGDQADALALVRTNVGNDNMLTLRRLVGEFQAELDAELLRQVGLVFEDDRLVILIDLAGLVIIALLGWQIARAIRRYLASLAEAREAARMAYGELERNNERLDEMVQVRTADLTAANDEIQRFAYIVSHDLRAPLVNIMGFTSEMEQASALVARYVVTEGAPGELTQAATEDIPEALRFIRSSTSKMDRLINAILKLSREGRRVLSPEPVDMRGLFGGIADTMQHQAASKDTSITVGDLPDVIADRLALEQIFGNLVDNALKYLRSGVPGEVKISGRRSGSRVIYQVSDNGRGIAARDHERVFELFRRAGDQTVPGEGIGLAHVRALIRRLGGTIDCNSTLDVGTTFTIRLPATAKETREIAA